MPVLRIQRSGAVESALVSLSSGNLPWHVLMASHKAGANYRQGVFQIFVTDRIINLLGNTRIDAFL
jgi:hypothetical protein